MSTSTQSLVEALAKDDFQSFHRLWRDAGDIRIDGLRPPALLATRLASIRLHTRSSFKKALAAMERGMSRQRRLLPGYPDGCEEDAIWLRFCLDVVKIR